ncbi:MAG: glycosyltransferase family 4 protein [Planctomycetaceae bacterium]|nr:glycosyltransferase family 4 protein [Planctomycetaceae bacterium]
MIHVGLLFEYATLNGGEQSMLAVLRRLTGDPDIQFTAFAQATGPLAAQLRSAGIPLTAFCVRDEHGRKRPAGELLEQLNLAVSRCDPPLDLLHANSLSMARLVGQLTRSDIKRTGHLRDIIKLNKKVIADLNASDRLVAVSAATRDFHVAQGLHRPHCDVLFNGVDTNRFCPEPSLRSDLLAVPPDAAVILNVGQICLRKGQLDLARVVAAWPDDRTPVHLVLVGERHSTKQESVDYEQNIGHVFDLAGRSDRLHCVGYREDVPRWMRAADLLVHTARQEPLGRVLLEAAACGLPIVATDVGGTGEILIDGQTAWLVPPDSPQHLQAAISEALQHPATSAARAMAARQRICELFDIRGAAARLADFWRSVVGRTTGPV